MDITLVFLGLILLLLRFGEGLLPSAIRIVGSIMVVIGAIMYCETFGMAMLIAGILTVATSSYTIIKNFEEITLWDGTVAAIGVIEAIIGIVSGV